MSQEARSKVQVIRIRLRPERAQEFIDWVRDLENRNAEVEDAIRGERIDIESLFLDESGDVLMYQASNDLSFATEALMISNKPVDIEAREMFARCVAAVTPLEPLLHARIV